MKSETRDRDLRHSTSAIDVADSDAVGQPHNVVVGSRSGEWPGSAELLAAG
jgi:hypothetical protein